MPKSNMPESNTPIAIFGIIAIAILAFIVLVILNIIPIPGVYSPYVIEEGSVVKQTESEVDLRLVALPYLTATDVKSTCIAAGGTWHEEADFVGCEGFGPIDCNTAIVTSAMTQCIGAGGNWTCSPEGIYCSI